MYTKQHYQAVANVFRRELISLDLMLELSTGESPVLEGSYIEWNRLREDFKVMFQSDNSRFKPELFDKACSSFRKYDDHA